VSRLFDKRLLRDVVGAVEAHQQELDGLGACLAGAAVERSQLSVAAPGREYGALLGQLTAPVYKRLEALGTALPREREDLLRGMRHSLEEATAQLRAANAHLGGHDPRAPKKLGYALVWKEDGTLVRDPAQVALGERLKLEVRDGSLHAKRE
jgi:exonuclease VII large subunit